MSRDGNADGGEIFVKFNWTVQVPKKKLFEFFSIISSFSKFSYQTTNRITPK